MTALRVSIGLMIALAGLAGCSAIGPYLPGHSARLGSPEGLLAYGERVAQLDEAAARQELQRLLPVDGGCSRARLRIALLAAHWPGQADAHGDVLAPCRADDDLQGTTMGHAVTLLDHQLQLARRNRSLAAELAERSAENRDLRNKLEQLKSLERSIQGREHADGERDGGSEP